MADWVALSVLAQGPATNNRQLAKALGVTRQRANQIKTSLERNKLISATQSSEDARQNVITLTSRGQAQLGDINEKILTVLSSSLKEKKGALLKANSSVRILLRMVRAEAGGNERPARARVRRRKLAARSAGTGI
jgi:DNA-binding MarR family transcriptional regulator